MVKYKEMKISDNKIKELYLKGFNDELHSKKPVDWFKTEVEKRAYFTGRGDAIIGDEVSSNNYRSWEEILKEIKDL